MREYYKPIVVLMLLAPLLTELLSGNIPLTAFNPAVYLFLATVGYGFPILLLRELGVRRGVGLLGMLPLGLCYGIVNEGFLAKTFFLPHNVPIPTFDQYGFFGGIEVPWALTISSWHALFAFLFPILIVETIFPEFRGKPWLSRKGALGMILPTGLLSVMLYFGTQIVPPRPAGTLPNFVEIWLAFVGLAALALVLPAQPLLENGGRFQARKVWIGVAVFLAVLVIPFIFAGAKVPPPMFFGYFVALAGFTWLLLGHRTAVGHASLVLCALGAYTAQALFGILIGIQSHSPVLIATEGAFVVAFALGMNRMRTLKA